MADEETEPDDELNPAAKAPPPPPAKKQKTYRRVSRKRAYYRLNLKGCCSPVFVGVPQNGGTQPLANEESNPADEEFTQKEKEHQQYLDERKELIDAARESTRTFDKAILAFGSVVFGFSIAFLKDVAPKPARETLPWLGAAWGLFAFGLLLILLSFLFSHRACMFEANCATERIIDPDCAPKKNHWSVFTDWCNFVCIAFLFLGLISWSVFAFQNLEHEGNPSVNKVEIPTEKKGYVPPAAPAKVPVKPPAAAPQPVEKR